MKSILIASGIIAPDIGGPASYARLLGTRLAKDGVAVTVLSYSSVRRHAPDASSPFRVIRVWSRIPWGLRHALYAWRCWRLTRHADLVLALNAVSAGVPAAWAAKRAGKPFVVRIAGDYAWEMAVQAGKTFLLIDDFQNADKHGRIGRLDRTQRRVCRHADAVIVPSRYLAGLVAGWGIDEAKIRVIHNGVDLPTADGTKEEARKALAIPGNVILSAGRLVPWKGFRMLIKLMPQLLQVNQFFRLVIVGDGPDMGMLRSVTRTLGLERKVLLVGRKSAAEMSRYLRAADMFVLNTGYEGFSHQLLEAMAAGVPVITTTAGGNREVVNQGENGLMVRYNDEFNLVEAIKAVWKQADLREKMVKNALQTVARFSPEKMYAATAELLQQILK